MICHNCRAAGESNTEYISQIDDKYKQDWEGRTKALHALCDEKDCFCQHRIGDLIFRK